MSILQTSYNFDFLNNYFTTKEFDFINNSNSENQKLDELILQETNTRDVIVNFINRLNDSASDLRESKSNAEFMQLLSEVQDIFEKANDNIKMLHELKTASSQLSDNIINLLIKVESNPNVPTNYIDEIQKLKYMINEFSQKSDDVKSKLVFNDIKINTFLKKNIVKEYVSDININMDSPKKSESFKVKSKNSIIPDSSLEGNDTLLVSEKLKKVFLPYSRQEVLLYLEQHPNEYKSFEDVVDKEFIFPLDYYMKHSVVARFRETYSLIRDRESKSIIDAFKYALDMMFKYDVNPAIIAACKTQEQLENYLSCLERKKLDEFTDFKIKFEINPL